MYANCYISFIFSTGNAPLESFETKEAAQKCPNVDATKKGGGTKGNGGCGFTEWLSILLCEHLPLPRNLMENK